MISSLTLTSRITILFSSMNHKIIFHRVCSLAWTEMPPFSRTCVASILTYTVSQTGGASRHVPITIALSDTGRTAGTWYTWQRPPPHVSLVPGMSAVDLLYRVNTGVVLPEPSWLVLDLRLGQGQSDLLRQGRKQRHYRKSCLRIINCLWFRLGE